MKKAKVTKITKWDKKPGYNDTSFTIEFDNGDKGYYSSKDDDQKRFVAGQEAEYIIEQKEGKNNQKYFKITSPLDEQKPAWSGGGSKKPQIEPRIQMISFAAAYTKDLVVGGKVQMNDFEKEFNKIYNVMTAKI
jgi:hypothetical protein